MERQLYQALTTLLSVCDGAEEIDGAGYNGVDAPFARDLVFRANKQGLTPNQQVAAHKMLRKYKKQLSSHGIDYDSIPKPDKEKLQKELEEKLLPLDDYLNSIKFPKVSGKEVNIGGERKRVYNAELPKNFWTYWKKYKQEIKDKGYSVTKRNGFWELAFWETIGKKPAKKKLAPQPVKPKSIKLKFKDLLLKYQRPHVKKLIASMKSYNSALDSSDTGTGKTYSSLAVAKEMGLTPIIVTPKSVKSSFNKVLKDHFEIDGYVNNYEQFRNGNTKYLTKKDYKDNDGKRHIEFIWNVPDDHVIIFDEVHRCKNHKTQNSQMLVSAAEQDKKVIAMSATIGDNPLHMYALGRVLKLFDNVSGYFNWIYTYGCYKSSWGGLEFDGNPEHLKNIHKTLYPRHGSRISIDKLGDLFPENKTIVDSYDMNGNAKKIDKIYKDMQKELGELTESMSRVTDHHLALMQKARQKIEILKVPAFVEMANDAIESGHSVVLFVNYNQTIEALAKKLKTNCIVWGNNKKGEREKNIESFQADESRIIICNTGAGGVGISLHDLNGHFSRLSIISPDWSAQKLLQALGRIHRAGGKSKSIQKVVFAAGSIEEEICERVRNKIDNIGVLNDGDLNAVSILSK